ncbi:MAG: serine/threonine protein kinase [Myxococcaceae bacterium]
MAAPFIPLAPDTFSGRKLGKYEIVCRLSTGGMSEIFLAFQKGLGGFRKYCVLKLILPDIKGEEEFVRMFLDEAKITAAFNHPNIAHVYDLDIADGELFLAMEFVPGATLVEVARMCRLNSEPIPIGMTLQTVRDTALALHYAHTFTDSLGTPQPVIHRDIAEKNIMVTYEGSTKLLDFGIAKNTSAIGRTMVGMVKGTTGYMSPEQILGETLDGRSDLFSLGVVLHECLTGMRLFHAKNPEQGMLAPLKEAVAPPSRQNPNVTPEIDAVVLKSLKRNREERHPTLLDFARELERAAGPLIWHPEQTAPFVQRLFAERREQTRNLLTQVSQAQSELTGEVRLNELLRGEVRAPAPPPLPPAPITKPPPPVPAETTDPGRDVIIAPPAPRKPTQANTPLPPKKTGRTNTGEITNPRTPAPRKRDPDQTNPGVKHQFEDGPGERTQQADDDAPEPVTLLNRPKDLLKFVDPSVKNSRPASPRSWAPPPPPAAPPVPDDKPVETPWEAEVTGEGNAGDDEEPRTVVQAPIKAGAKKPRPSGEHDTVSNVAPRGSGRRKAMAGAVLIAALAVGGGLAWMSGAFSSEEMKPVVQQQPQPELPLAHDEKHEEKKAPVIAEAVLPVPTKTNEENVVDAGVAAVVAQPEEKVADKVKPTPTGNDVAINKQNLHAGTGVEGDPSLEAKKKPAVVKKAPVKHVEAASSEEKAAGQGQLTLVTTPWARVQFKSQDLGATPLFKVALPAGKHTLKLTGPDNQIVMLPVEIKDGEVTTIRQKLADVQTP